MLKLHIYNRFHVSTIKFSATSIEGFPPSMISRNGIYKVKVQKKVRVASDVPPLLQVEDLSKIDQRNDQMAETNKSTKKV